MDEINTDSQDLRRAIIVAVAVVGVYMAVNGAKNIAYRSYLKAKKNQSK